MFGKKSKDNQLSKEQEEKVNKKFKSFTEKKLSEEDVNKAVNNEETIMNKMNDKNLRGFIEDVKLFFLMLKDFVTRKYKDVPVGTIMAIACSLLYVLSPIDIIPDFIPGVGYIDDAGIIALCLSFVKNDLDKYKEFKKSEK